MTDRTRRQVVEHAIDSVLSELSIGLHGMHQMSDDSYLVTISRNRYEMTYHMVWLPHPTLSALSRIEHTPSRERLLVGGPHISSRTAESLRTAGIDYIDSSGNAHLSFGPVLIDVRGRRSPARELHHRSPDANLFSAKRMQVIFVLLVWPDLVDMPIRQIAKSAGTSLGLTQSTMETLKDLDYLLGSSIRRREELVDLWTAAFRGSLLPKLRQSSYFGDIQRWAPSKGNLVSGESAVELIQKPQTLTIYADSFDISDAIENGWRKSDDPNIEVRKKFWLEPGWSTEENNRDIFARLSVPPLLVYADLNASKESRQLEVARLARNQNRV